MGDVREIRPGVQGETEGPARTLLDAYWSPVDLAVDRTIARGFERIRNIPSTAAGIAREAAGIRHPSRLTDIGRTGLEIARRASYARTKERIAETATVAMDILDPDRVDKRERMEHFGTISGSLTVLFAGRELIEDSIADDTISALRYNRLINWGEAIHLRAMVATSSPRELKRLNLLARHLEKSIHRRYPDVMHTRVHEDPIRLYRKASIGRDPTGGLEPLHHGILENERYEADDLGVPRLSKGQLSEQSHVVLVDPDLMPEGIFDSNRALAQRYGGALGMYVVDGEIQWVTVEPKVSMYDQEPGVKLAEIPRKVRLPQLELPLVDQYDKLPDEPVLVR